MVYILAGVEATALAALEGATADGAADDAAVEGWAVAPLEHVAATTTTVVSAAMARTIPECFMRTRFLHWAADDSILYCRPELDDADTRDSSLDHPPPCRSIARASRRACSRYAPSNRALDRTAPTTLARVMTGGIAPRATRSSAVRTLIALTMATAPMVDPGPMGVSREPMVTIASAGGEQMSRTRSATSSSRAPAAGSGSAGIGWATGVTAVT